MLRRDRSLNDAVMNGALHLELIQKMLIYAVTGLAAHGLMVGFLGTTVSALAREVNWNYWLQGQPILWMPLALVLAFLGTLVICLPSFYFYTQLAGLDASPGLIVIQALRVMARTGLLLLGTLPFYLALMLASVLNLLGTETVLAMGLGIPFLVGLAGLSSLYRSFKELLLVLPITHQRRGNFVLHFILAWGLLYLTIAPMALWFAGETLGPLI